MEAEKGNRRATLSVIEWDMEKVPLHVDHAKSLLRLSVAVDNNQTVAL